MRNELVHFIFKNLNYHYFNKVGLINKMKIQFMRFKNYHMVLLDNCILKEGEYTTFVGVIIDEYLNWNEHVNNVA